MKGRITESYPAEFGCGTQRQNNWDFDSLKELVGMLIELIDRLYLEEFGTRISLEWESESSVVTNLKEVINLSEFIIRCDKNYSRSTWACVGKLQWKALDDKYVILQCDKCFRLQVYKRFR